MVSNSQCVDSSFPGNLQWWKWKILVLRGLFPKGFCSRVLSMILTVGELSIWQGELITKEMLLNIWNVFDPDIAVDVMSQMNVSGNTRKELRTIWEVRRYYFQRREVFQTKDHRMIEEVSDSLGPRPAPLPCPWMASLTKIQNKWWNWSPSVTRSLPTDTVCFCNDVFFIFSFKRSRDFFARSILSLPTDCLTDRWSETDLDLLYLLRRSFSLDGSLNHCVHWKEKWLSSVTLSGDPDWSSSESPYSGAPLRNRCRRCRLMGVQLILRWNVHLLTSWCVVMFRSMSWLRGCSRQGPDECQKKKRLQETWFQFRLELNGPEVLEFKQSFLFMMKMDHGHFGFLQRERRGRIFLLFLWIFIV